MKRKFRVGLVGCGSIAENAHLPILSEMDNVELVGVIAKRLASAQTAKERYGISHAVENIEQVD